MVKKWSFYWVNLDPVIGSEQAGRRPVLVISNDIVNEILPIVTVIPVSSVKDKFKVYPTEVYLPSEKSALPKDSVAMVHQIRTISKERLMDNCGSIEDDVLRNEVNAVLAEYFEL
jgi:mRNA interferase MazF